MTGRREEPRVCLLPCLDNFVKAIEKVHVVTCLVLHATRLLPAPQN